MSGIVHEDGTSDFYQSMKYYTDKLKTIVNNPGYLIKNFKSVEEQINSINSMKDIHKNKGVHSIKSDIYDMMERTTDWNSMRNDLKEYIKKLNIEDKNKNLLRSNKLLNEIDIKPFKPFKFKYNDVWEPLTDEYLNNMFLDLSDFNNSLSIEELKNSPKEKKKYLSYKKNKNIFFNELNQFLNDINDWENSLTQCRNNNYPILKYNIKCLYNIHKKYVYEKYNKIKSGFEKEVNGTIIDCVEYNTGKKTIYLPLDNSQSKFIKNSIALMLGLK